MIYENYLKEELNKCRAQLGLDDVVINVAPERSFKLPKDENQLLFVVKKLTGSYVLNIKTQPVQIICYSELNTFSIAQQIFEYFVLTHKNGSADSTFYEDTTLIKQDYDTPVALRAILPTDIGFKASFYCYGSYVECANLSDVRDLKWKKDENDYETPNYISATVSYAAVLNTAKISGKEISTSMKQEAGLNIQVVLMNDNSDFVKQINKIMLGKLSGNTAFTLSFTLNGEQFEEDFVLADASFATDRVNAPGLNVTFTR